MREEKFKMNAQRFHERIFEEEKNPNEMAIDSGGVFDTVFIEARAER